MIISDEMRHLADEFVTGRIDYSDLQNVSTGDIYSILEPLFMSANTPYRSVDAFLDACGFSTHDLSALNSADAEKLDIFVAANTRFFSWHQMLQTASRNVK